MKPVALFVRKDSIYKELGLDSYDIDRDARNYNGNNPVIAHPPCRAWGRLRKFAKPRPDEKELAIRAVQLVRKNGGVLEHPAFSSLWKYLNLPTGSMIDQYGGFTLSINQSWFGHKAEKKTFLYIVGVDPGAIPKYPLNFNRIEYTVGCSKARFRTGKKEITKAEREHTPPDLAKWLISLCKKISAPN